jgi:hypothetical protein
MVKCVWWVVRKAAETMRAEAGAARGECKESVWERERERERERQQARTTTGKCERLPEKCALGEGEEVVVGG